MAQATALTQEMDAHSAQRLAYRRLLTVVHHAAWHLLKQGKMLELMMIWTSLRAKQGYPEAHNTSIALHIPLLFSFRSELSGHHCSGVDV